MKRGGPLKRYTPLRKKARKRSIGGLKNELWTLFSLHTRRRNADENGMVACVSCPAIKHWTQMQAGHYLPKSLGIAIYFEERNVHPQCSTCNLTLQGNQYPYALFLQNKYGVGILDELTALRHTKRQIKRPEYLELIEVYKRKLELLDVTEAA